MTRGQVSAWIHELALAAVFCVANLLILFQTQAFMLVILDQPPRWIALLFALLPVLVAYAAARVVLPALTAAAVVTGMHVLLSAINQIKLQLTNAPLAWSDLASTDNLTIVPSYLNARVVLMLVAVLAAFAGLLWADRHLPRLQGFKRRVLYLVLAGVCAPLAFYSYASVVHTRWAEQLAAWLTTRDVYYMSWNELLNQRANGVVAHLMHTSVPRQLPTATAQEQAAYDALRAQARAFNAAPRWRPRHVVMVLCESCWHDDTWFKAEFEPLYAMGFQGAQAYAPTFGGGTVNSTFELLTGLPSGGTLSGIIYHEYGRQLSPQVRSLPQAFREAGYRTLALHNFHRRFWRRDLVNPKMGFDRFIALEDMAYDGPNWPPDHLLYDRALAELQAAEQPVFMYLTTMSTHGSYQPDNDHGEGDYARRLGVALKDLAAFAQALRRADPDAVVVVVGDHKPALPDFFYQSGALPADLFVSDAKGKANLRPSVSVEDVGSVPLLVLASARADAPRFLREVDQKPFFCVSDYLARTLAGIITPVHAYTQANGLCDTYTTGHYAQVQGLYPPWLFADTLFAAPRAVSAH